VSVPVLCRQFGLSILVSADIHTTDRNGAHLWHYVDLKSPLSAFDSIIHCQHRSCIF